MLEGNLNMVLFVLAILAVLGIIWVSVRSRSVARRVHSGSAVDQEYQPRVVPHRPPRATPRASSYERFPRLNASMRQTRARRELLATLTATPVSLINLLHRRAIDLYCEQYGVSWQEAVQAINELMYTPGEPLTFAHGADPLVTALLLQAGCRADAILYFSRSSNASPEEAEAAVNFVQAMIDDGDWSFAQERLSGEGAFDLASLRFLLGAGYKILAIRYYHQRTGVSLSEASRMVEEIELPGKIA